MGLHEVQRSLGRQPTATGAVPATSEPAEVTWLRRYSNYLAPRVGPFSTDSLTLVATWLRNVGLNLIVLLSCLAAAFIAPLLLLDPLSVASAYNRAFGFGAAWLGLLFLLGIAFNLWHQGLPVNRLRNWMISAPGVMATVVVPGMLAAAAGAVWLFQAQTQVEGRTFSVVYVSILLLLLLFVWFIAEGVKRKFPAALIREAAVHAGSRSVYFAVSSNHSGVRMKRSLLAISVATLGIFAATASLPARADSGDITLKMFWEMADKNKDSMVTKQEFLDAMSQ